MWTEFLQGEAGSVDELAYVTTTPARPARTEPLPVGVHDAVRESLARQGVELLFTHPADAWEAAIRGEHVVVTTGNASG